ncbi:SpoIIE family protein phosphatase [Allochromatium palmeri]|uniref:SpoIIE family protein phosphatase n=1 Tax=Allochromatium palmeri TaxID=231048 RepID=UPI0031B594F5
MAIILGASLGLYQYQARELLLQRLQENAQSRSLALVQRVERVLITVRRAIETLAGTLESASLSQDDVPGLMRHTLEMNPEIFGIAMGFEPSALGHPDRRHVPYVFRRDGRIELSLEPGAQDYLFEDWYQIPRELGLPEWSEPYYELDDDNVQLIATFSLPVMQPKSDDQRLRGILAADIALDWFTCELAEFKVLQHGFAVLISRNGAVLSHPDTDCIMNENLFSLAAAWSDSALREQARTMIGGGEGFIQNTPLFGVMAHVYFAPIAGSDWTLAIVFPENELFRDINRLTLNAAIVGSLGLGLSLLVVLSIAGSISRPLRVLADSTERIAKSDFDAPLPEVQRGDEVGQLTESFAAMRTALRQHIEWLRTTTAAKERIESELAIARDIQMSILPKLFPPIPNRDEFDLRALIVPAREVGGDFYDFFPLDKDRLCFLIADVSGKGVPAALFMAVTKTLIKSTARDRQDPAEILTQVNAELAADNASNMFVTVFCGVLDARTGALEYVNAGHNPPVLIGTGGQSPRWLKGTPQLLLGIMEGVVYRSASLRLAPGERLLLYTDGVTEAMNGQDEFYSEVRLLDTLESEPQPDLVSLLAMLLERVQSFAGETPQSDDITLLAIEYRGQGQRPIAPSSASVEF